MFYEDGIATTVSVDQWDKTYSLKNNGKVDASNDADMPTQIVVGLLPLLFYRRPHPPKVALVGFGSGVTAGAITQYPIASLEVVELEPAVYRARTSSTTTTTARSRTPRSPRGWATAATSSPSAATSSTSSSASRRTRG